MRNGRSKSCLLLSLIREMCSFCLDGGVRGRIKQRFLTALAADGFACDARAQEHTQSNENSTTASVKVKRCLLAKAQIIRVYFHR